MSETVTKFTGYAVTDFVCDLAYWKRIATANRPACRWLIVGEEVCPDTQRKHFQCAVWWVNPREKALVLKELQPRHVEVAYSSAVENREYCSKEGNVLFEHGEVPQQGRRTDLIELTTELKEGYTTLDRIIMERPMIYH